MTVLDIELGYVLTISTLSVEDLGLIFPFFFNKPLSVDDRDSVNLTIPNGDLVNVKGLKTSSVVNTYRPLLLTPVQFFAHDLDDTWECLVGRLHIQEAQASSPGDDIDGGAGVLLNRI